MMRTYEELIKYDSLMERFKYLKLDGDVGNETFGFDRYLNQRFYKSKEWQDIRNYVITRDRGLDMGVEGFDISGKILIHHMNPISVSDIVNQTDVLLNPNYLISVSHKTHNALHYGDESIIATSIVNVRSKNDTCLWR